MRLEGIREHIITNVGRRLRMRRRALMLTQAALAEMVGVSFQQIQKYETAEQRCNLDTLWMITQVLGVDMNYFFENAPRGLTKSVARLEDALGSLTNDIRTRKVVS